MRQNGSVPDYSNRDPVYVDVEDAGILADVDDPEAYRSLTGGGLAGVTK